MRIVVAGSCVGVPHQGGATWAVLQYVLGLRALGHDVLLVEPARCDPAVVGRFTGVVLRHDLVGRAALLHGDGVTSGLRYPELAEWMTSADVLLNLSGVLVDEELTGPIPLRVYVDLDPAFTQLWCAGGTDMRWAGHHRFATIGRAIGTLSSDVPTGGVTWVPTTPPVALDAWPVVESPPQYGFTTVGNWRSYGPIDRGGVTYGQKAHAARALLELPLHAPGVAFEPAFAIHPAERSDLAALASHGWRLVEPRAVAGDPERYRSFLRASTAEIGVAKSGYVLSRCGWFSDRSVCYLASGRPVVAHDTGWPAFYPSGNGLLAFSSVEEAAGAVRDVLGSYRRHCRAARAIAEDVFDARKVLAQLLTAVGANP
jgi:hypothetical protein